MNSGTAKKKEKEKISQIKKNENVPPNALEEKKEIIEDKKEQIEEKKDLTTLGDENLFDFYYINGSINLFKLSRQNIN